MNRSQRLTRTECLIVLKKKSSENDDYIPPNIATIVYKTFEFVNINLNVEFAVINIGL